MFEQFSEKFPQSHPIQDKYRDCFTRLEVPAKTVLLREGELSKKAFVIEKGCIRAWFNNNGKDITFQFFFEHETVSSVESFRKNIPSPVTVETVEPCIVWWISKKDFNRMLEDVKEIPVLRDFFIDAIFERTFNYMNHFFSSIRDTPQQRYLNLLKNKPQIVKRVPQHYIASYLGITTVHLSRIKSKIARENH